MANEITTKIEQNLTNGDLKDSVTLSFRTDQVTAVAAGSCQIVGTTEEALYLGDVSSPGPSVIINLDATNYIEIGRVISASFEPFAKLMPGEAMCFQPAGSTTPYVRANTTSVTIRRLIPSL